MPPGKYRICTLHAEKELEEWLKQKYQEAAQEAIKTGQKIPTMGPLIETILTKIMQMEKRGEIKIKIEPTEIKIARRT
jgi:preprotein translocase subunit YajC